MTWGQSSGQVKYHDAVKQIELMLQKRFASLTQTDSDDGSDGFIILDTARV
jgi:hypothetical protein